MEERVRRWNQAELRPGGRYVLYWRRVNRRAESNHALAFAADLANRLALPLVVYESLSCRYPYASRRFHTFALEGAVGAAAEAAEVGAAYCFHLARTKAEPNRGAEMTRQAAAMVVDDFPELLAPRLELDLPVYAVDSSCIVPHALIGGKVYAAYSMRPRVRKLLPRFFKPAPQVNVKARFRDALPEWHTEVRKECIPALVVSCEIDHGVPPSVDFRGGRPEGLRRLEEFLEDRLRRYAREKNEPAARATSDLSPYLHWGYLSSLEVALAAREHAEQHKLMADEFLEELIVRRELAFNFAWHARRLDSLDELPEWARQTLAKHASDPREHEYTRDRLEAAETADDLWNATQKELLMRGKIHGYYRMYWGKKILEWSHTPDEALATMVHLNDRYALDGQDPNGYANILWCLGLHDRPWPERAVYGTVRSMGRAGMERKTSVTSYIQEIERLERT